MHRINNACVFCVCVCLCVHRCQTDPCDECEYQSQSHAVGDRWRSDHCLLCHCLPNLTVQCSPYCPYAVSGCPQVTIRNVWQSVCLMCIYTFTHSLLLVYVPMFYGYMIWYICTFLMHLQFLFNLISFKQSRTYSLLSSAPLPLYPFHYVVVSHSNSTTRVTESNVECWFVCAGSKSGAWRGRQVLLLPR